jgi:hypothetical protein
MHLPINVKSPNNISKCQVGFNSAFKVLKIAVGRNCLRDVLIVYVMQKGNEPSGSLTCGNS